MIEMPIIVSLRNIDDQWTGMTLEIFEGAPRTSMEGGFLWRCRWSDKEKTGYIYGGFERNEISNTILGRTPMWLFLESVKSTFTKAGISYRYESWVAHFTPQIMTFFLHEFGKTQ